MAGFFVRVLKLGGISVLPEATLGLEKNVQKKKDSQVQ
jgi:hypothetical protein